MRISVFLIAQITAFIIAMFPLRDADSMGRRGSAGYLQREENEIGHEGNKGPAQKGQKIFSGTTGTQNRDAATEIKRPRLKFREEPKCPC